MAIGVLIAAFIAGVGLLVLGLRGRLVDDHPICRKCGFDLVGVYGAGAANRCSECGVGLTRAAVRVGNRRRRRGTAAVGIVLIVIAGCGIGLLTWAQSSGVNWNKYKPMPWLHWEGRHAESARAFAALDEIAARMKSDRVSRGVATSFVAEALMVQADRTTVWNPGWGDILEAAIEKGWASPEQELLYDTQAASVIAELRVQPRMYSGQTPKWDRQLKSEMVQDGKDDGSLVGSEARVGSTGRAVSLVMELAGAQLDGQPIQLIELDPASSTVGPYYQVLHFAHGRGGSRSGDDRHEPLLGLPPINAAPGTHTLTLTWEVRLLNGPTGPAVRAKWLTSATGTFEIYPPDRPLVRMVSDPQIAAKIRAAYQVGSVELKSGQRPTLAIELRWVGLPEEPRVWANLLIRARDHQVRAFQGELTESSHRDGEASYYTKTLDPDWAAVEKVDLVLVPDAEQAARAGLEAIWGEEIVFEAVPVQRK